MFQITEEQFKKIFPKANPKYLLPGINEALKKFGFDTKMAASCFIAQIGHESGELTVFKENLNYSADGLQKTFGKYFPTRKLAEAYARKPEKIANRVYANRMGNKDEESGDGWRYRGRGAIQLTGYNNYYEFSKYVNMSLADTIVYLETAEGAIVSAGWFFATNGLVPMAKKGQVTLTTKRINGGTNGLDHRISLYNKAMKVLD